MHRAAFVLSLALSAVRASAAPPSPPDVLVAADVLVKEVEHEQPTAQKPVYYYLLSDGLAQIGTPIGGEPPPPDRAAVEKLIEQSLAKAHYLRARVGGPPPTLVIKCGWGFANPDIDEMEVSDPTTGATSTQTTFQNRDVMRSLTGADKAAQHLLMSDEADTINSAVQENRLFLALFAYDADPTRRAKRKMLWRTKLSTDALHHSLADAVPAMLASAVPYFGRELEKPLVVTAEDRRKAEVHIGTPIVVEPAKAK